MCRSFLKQQFIVDMLRDKMFLLQFSKFRRGLSFRTIMKTQFRTIMKTLFQVHTSIQNISANKLLEIKN